MAHIENISLVAFPNTIPVCGASVPSKHPKAVPGARVYAKMT
jgi:hypothetical protein